MRVVMRKMSAGTSAAQHCACRVTGPKSSNARYPTPGIRLSALMPSRVRNQATDGATGTPKREGISYPSRFPRVSPCVRLNCTRRPVQYLNAFAASRSTPESHANEYCTRPLHPCQAVLLPTGTDDILARPAAAGCYTRIPYCTGPSVARPTNPGPPTVGAVATRRVTMESR
jgi:hypothetical protein